MSIPATLSEIAARIQQVLTEDGPLAEPELVSALQARGVDLGAYPQDTVADILDSDDAGLAMPLGDGRTALLPALLAGRVFTHRVNGAEIEHGFLNVSADLDPISFLTEATAYQRLVDGSELIAVVSGFDDDLLDERDIPRESVDECAWLLDPQALHSLDLTAGDLIAVTVQPNGFALSKIKHEPTENDSVAPIVETLQQLGEGRPEFLNTVVWLACANNPGLFATVERPLSELLVDAGLVVDGDWVGPAGFDFPHWRAKQRIDHVAEIHQLNEDEALAVLALARLYEQLAQVVDHLRVAEDAGAADDLLVASDAAAGWSGTSTDDELVSVTLGFLEEPAVAAALLAETIGAGREGAAALGLFTESLEPRASRAARPALRWMRGKAWERLGDLAQAEAAFEAAYDLDPTSPLPLFDLARIASDRGDAVRGLSLLRQAGAPPDDELALLLQRFQPTERRDIGRNDLCWCGSGRKYKVCHRTRETIPLDERAFWLYQKALHYLADGPWRGNLVDVAEIRAAHWDDPMALYQALQDPLVCDAMLFEGGAFEAFINERGHLLPDDERLLADQWLLVERSLFDVEEVTPGSGFVARDLRTGDRLEVRERTASRFLTPGMLICARLAQAGDTIQCFGGLEPVALHQRDALIELLDDRPDPDEIVDALSRRFEAPVLQNTEGEPLVLCEATLRTRDPQVLAAALDTAYDGDDTANRWHEPVTTHGVQRLRATITLDGTTVRVETNSEPRMDRVLGRLRELDPGLEVVAETRHPADEVQEALARSTEPAPESDDLDPDDDPLVAAALAEAIRAHETAWLDGSIPALGGVTPREAAADPTRRPDLVRLLASFDDSGPGTMDVARLRRELGI